MKNKFQRVHTYTFDDTDYNKRLGTAGKQKTGRQSFKTLENAIKNSEMWISKPESWIDVTTIRIDIIDKETGETVWTYEA